jgi:hypothetical protein
MLRSPEFPVVLQLQTRSRELNDDLRVLRQIAAARRTPRRRSFLGLVRSSSRRAQPASDCA